MCDIDICKFQLLCNLVQCNQKVKTGFSVVDLAQKEVLIFTGIAYLH